MANATRLRRLGTLGDPEPFGLWIVDADRCDRDVQIAGDGLDKIAAPVWSPDGRTIAFAASLEQDPIHRGTRT